LSVNGRLGQPTKPHNKCHQTTLGPASDVVDQWLCGSHPPLVYQLVTVPEAMKAMAPYVPEDKDILQPEGRFGHLDVATLDRVIDLVLNSPTQKPASLLSAKRA
jgi:hypothetical protein